MGWIEDQMRATRVQFPDPGVQSALDSKAMRVEKRSTGRDDEAGHPQSPNLFDGLILPSRLS